MVRSGTPLGPTDPEPIILAIMIIGAGAATTSAIIALRRQRRETKEAQKEFDARRDKVKRALKHTRAALEELAKQLEAQGKSHSLFKIGSVQLILNQKDMKVYQQAFDDLADALRSLNEIAIQLADKVKDQTLDAHLRSIVDRIDGLLKEANTAKTYSDFVRTTRLVLEELGTLLDQTK
jgi:hypothetical protein